MITAETRNGITAALVLILQACADHRLFADVNDHLLMLLTNLSWWKMPNLSLTFRRYLS